MQQLAFDYIGTEYGGFPVCMNLRVIDYTLVCLVHGTEALWVRK